MEGWSAYLDQLPIRCYAGVPMKSRLFEIQINRLLLNLIDSLEFFEVMIYRKSGTRLHMLGKFRNLL